ncbi:hypothetical protein HYC85_018674 [Camellia sinensis]|uniref:Uncharacterized protein n=1 Tax=Camellia sinensis TaxID=4442 RepID=A0A7J7GVW6_CAMSI|nr:hypothetical protein HYC85_018674 [Camellia sinensis]
MYNISNDTKLLIFQFFYPIFLFAFSFLSTATIVFIVASLYIPKPQLFITYLWVSLIISINNIVFVGIVALLIIVVDTQKPILLFFSIVMIFILFLVVHVYITALWHLASVVLVLKPIFWFAAMKKSYELLKGRTQMAIVLVFRYLAIYEVIKGVFGAVVVHREGYGIFVRIMVSGFLVGVMVIVNLVVITTRGLTRVLYMIILEAILESMCPSKATFKWRTWMFEAMTYREREKREVFVQFFFYLLTSTEHAKIYRNLEEKLTIYT